MEVDILEDGSLDQDLDLLAELDVVVASVHSKLRMEAPAMTERMLAAIESPHTDILGHCTGRLITGRGPAAVDLRRRRGVRRLRPHRHRGGDQLAARAPGPARGPAAPGRRRSAAPSPSTPTPTRRASSAGSAGAARNAVGAEVPPERIVNRGSADELLAWAGAHGADRQ